MKAKVCEKTITYGMNQYRINSRGYWSCLMWGWWPDNVGKPEYRWKPISEDKVPDEVKVMK